MFFSCLVVCREQHPVQAAPPRRPDLAHPLDKLPLAPELPDIQLLKLPAAGVDAVGAGGHPALDDTSPLICAEEWGENRRVTVEFARLIGGEPKDAHFEGKERVQVDALMPAPA
jgi:hypothetical protein